MQDIIERPEFNTEEHLARLMAALVRGDDPELETMIESRIAELCTAVEEVALDVILYQHLAA